MRLSVGYRFGTLMLVASVMVSYGKATNLPTAEYTEWTTEKDIFVPMRDGIHLDTDVWLPKGTKQRLPSVLVRTLYDKDKMGNQVICHAVWIPYLISQQSDRI